MKTVGVNEDTSVLLKEIATQLGLRSKKETAELSIKLVDLLLKSRYNLFLQNSSNWDVILLDIKKLILRIQSGDNELWRYNG